MNRAEVEAGYAAQVADMGRGSSAEFGLGVHQVQTLHEIACQLADLNQTMLKILEKMPGKP